jgi:predicted DNA-binding transcriptional regulator YafY
MPVCKSQVRRLMRIAALLKENRYPNAVTLMEEFRRIELVEKIPIECCKKTILRDLQVLKKEYNCPLAFDRGQNGYYLKHHGWDFIAPALLDENEMIASVIGARVAEDIFPEPQKSRVRKAVDVLLNGNNPDFLDTANVKSLSILSGLYAAIDPVIFMTLFQAWQTRHCVEIAYADYKGEISERIIEPQTLVFFNNSWYTKAFCCKRSKPRTFALLRIRKAEMLSTHFEPDPAIINSITPDDFLGFEKIRKIKLQASPHALARLEAAPLHSKQKIKKDGIVEIPAVAREVLFPFLLSQQGDAVLLEPAELREEFKQTLQNMLAAY